MILERLVARIEGQSAQFDTTMTKIEGRQRSMTQRTSGMWKMFGMAAAAAVIAASVAVTSMAVQFDQSMRQVWTLVDITEAEFQTLKEGVLDVSAAIGESQTVTSRALYQAVSGGVALGEALEFVETAGRAAIAGATDIFSMTSLLVNITNAYADSQISAEHASDVLFTTIKYGVTTAEELGSSLGRVLGIASAAGIAFEDLSGVIAAATKFMGQTDLVVTGIRALIVGMLKPTKDAAEAAELLGLNWSAAALRAYGLHGMLVKLIEATEGNAELIALIVPETRALAVAMGFTGESLADAGTYIAEATEKMGAMSAAMRTQMEVGQKMKMFWQGLKADLMPLGDFFKDLGDKVIVMPELAARTVREITAAVRTGELEEEWEKLFRRAVDIGFTAEQVQELLGRVEQQLSVFYKRTGAEREADAAALVAAREKIGDWIAKRDEVEGRTSVELYEEQEQEKVDADFAAKLELKASAKEYFAYMEGAFRDESEALQDELDRRVTMHKKYAQDIERLQEKLRADQLAGAELLFRLELDHEQDTLEKMGILQARAAEMEAKANTALQEGNYKAAREYADNQLQLLEEIARKVISEGEAAAGMSFEDAKAAVEQGIAFQRQMTEVSIQYFETLAAEALTSIEQLEAKLHDLFAAASEELVIRLDASEGIAGIDELIDKLQQAIDRVAELDRKLSKGRYVPSAEVETHQYGGWVGGPRGVDRIPALLTAGEFVVQPRAAARHAELLQAINRGIVTPGQGTAVAAGNTYTTGPIELHFYNPVTRETVRDVVIPELEAAARRGLLTPTLGGRG